MAELNAQRLRRQREARDDLNAIYGPLPHALQNQDVPQGRGLPGARDQDPYASMSKSYAGGSGYGKSYDSANPNDTPGASTIAQVQQYLRSVLTSDQLRTVAMILSGVDTNSGGPPDATAMQRGGSVPGGQAGDDPPYFRGIPRTDGRGPSYDKSPYTFAEPSIPRPPTSSQPFGRDAMSGRGPTDWNPDQPSGFDRRRAMAGDAEIKRRLRAAGHPVGDYSPAHLRRYYQRLGGDAVMAGDSARSRQADDAELARMFPTARFPDSGSGLFAVPVGERRNARDDGRGGMAMDSGARRAYRNDAANAADFRRLFGNEFADRFASIKVVR